MDLIKIGKFIALCRKEKKLTQEQLAEMLNITNKSISKWENGSCLPAPSLYEPLCDILGITINELFAGQRIEKEDYQRIADDNLLRMLKYRLYQSGDKNITFAEFDYALNRMAEISTILKTFETKEEAIEYLMKGSTLSREECSTAYDYYSHLFTID